VQPSPEGVLLEILSGPIETSMVFFSASLGIKSEALLYV